MTNSIINNSKIVILLSILYFSIMISFSYYFETSWPCGIEPSRTWATAGCGYRLINHGDYRNYPIPSVVIAAVSVAYIYILFGKNSLLCKYGQSIEISACYLLLLSAIFFNYDFYISTNTFSAQILFIVFSSSIILILGVNFHRDMIKISKHSMSIFCIILISMMVMCLITKIYIDSNIKDVAHRSSVASLNLEEQDFLMNSGNKRIGQPNSERGFIIFAAKDCNFSQYLEDDIYKMKNENRNFWATVHYVDLSKIHDLNQSSRSKLEIIAKEIELSATPVVLMIDNSRTFLVKRRNLRYYTDR